MCEISIRIRWLIFFIVFSAGTAFSQHQDVLEKPGIWRGKQKQSDDTTSLLGAFKGGTVHGHFRYMFMSTHNQGDLQDFWANAAGGGIRFHTARFRGFSFGVSGFYIFNIGSHNLQNPDPVTGQLSRYEVALFDITNPHNTEDMDRLEELLINYKFSNTEITFGKQLLNTPFINLQDGRMRPTGVEGIYFDSREWKNTHIEGGFIYAFSPRSTIRWYNTGESIGAHPMGFAPDGQAQQYRDNVTSSGVGILGIHHKPTSWLHFHIWDFYIDNVMNTAMLQADINSGNQVGFIGGAQLVAQHAVNDGGNKNQALSYVQSDHQSYVYGFRTGYRSNQWESTLNYNRITSHGRYQFPREWGREPFFAFIPRERMEGMGDVHALSTRIMYKLPERLIWSSFSLGYVNQPSPFEHRLNKYGIPSYVHANLDLHIDHRGWAEGLETYILLMTKIKATSEDVPDHFIMNRVNLFHTSLVLNYHF
jgi:hypothetical protein